MATRSVFNSEKLRKLIEDRKTMAEIKAELNVTTTTLNNHLLKLMQLDGKVYKIHGSGVRNTVPKVTKNGLKITKGLLESFGFTDGEVKIERVGIRKLRSARTFSVPI